MKVLTSLVSLEVSKVTLAGEVTMSLSWKLMFAGLVSLGMFGGIQSADACWHRRCCCQSTHSSKGGSHESGTTHESSFTPTKSSNSSGPAAGGQKAAASTPAKPCAELTAIDERLAAVEKKLGLVKESGAETESAVVAAVAARIGMMVLEDLVQKKFGDVKTPVIVKPVPAVITKPKPPTPAATSPTPGISDEVKSEIKAAVKDGLLGAIKDPAFRKQFKTEFNKD